MSFRHIDIKMSGPICLCALDDAPEGRSLYKWSAFSCADGKPLEPKKPDLKALDGGKVIKLERTPEDDPHFKGEE